MKYRLILIVLLATIATGCASGRAFRKGQEAARNNDWDSAVKEYTKAVQEAPDKPEYKITLERAMQTAAQNHISRARELEAADSLDAAMAEYKRAVELDGTNRMAAAKVAELERAIRDRIEATRPRPQIDKLREQARAMNQPLIRLQERLPKLTFNNSSLKGILDFIGTSAGINITYETSFRDISFTINLEDVTAEQALQQIMVATNHFYKVLNNKTILIIPENAANHTKYDDLVIRTFYISHGDVAEINQVVTSMMRIQGIPVQPTILQNKTANTITVRATASVVDVIEKLIRTLDRPRAEVVVDVQILEVNRNRAKRLGLNLTDYSVGVIFSPEVAPPNTPGTSAPPPFNLNTISQGVSTADFYLSVPAAIVRFLATDSQTKLIAKPQLRGAEGAKLTLNLGDDIPVVQTVFGSAVAGGFASIPQSSFTYRSVGVNIEMTPRVTYEGDIKLELSLESSALGPNVNVGGQEAPSFSSRKVTTTLRLREGESNLLAGLLRDDQRKIMTGFPGVMRLPVIRSLFGQTNEEVSQSDIVMLLTPHIVRTHELTAEDLAPIFIGTQSNVGLGGPPPLIAAQPEPGTGEPAPTSPTGAGMAPGVPPAGVPRPPVTSEPGAQPVNRPAPPGTSTVPTAAPPVPTPPAGAPAPPAAPPVATAPPVGAPPTPTQGGVTPPRDPSLPVVTNPGAPAGAPATPAQIIVTPAGTEFRLGGGPYTTALSINNAQRLSTLTLTLTYNPNVLRVRTVQEGTFMRQGVNSASFTPRIDAAAGRVDIAVTRPGDQTGATGGGLIASLLFDAVGAGGSMIQVSGVATAPDGSLLALQFAPVTVTVR
jgi:general secretion pathway protein D